MRPVADQEASCQQHFGRFTKTKTEKSKESEYKYNNLGNISKTA